MILMIILCLQIHLLTNSGLLALELPGSVRMLDDETIIDFVNK